MNNRTLWQLTADGVAELRGAHDALGGKRPQQLLEELVNDANERHVVSWKVVFLNNSEAERIIESHTFELSSTTQCEQDNYKVYTVR